MGIALDYSFEDMYTKRKGANMKHFFSFISLVVLTSLGHADSFTVIRDGMEYLCESTQPENPGAALECADTAYRKIFDKTQSARLCAGARTNTPVDCAEKAYSLFNKEECIDLCIKARSTGPADCAEKAYRSVFDRTQAIELCKNNGSVAHAECAIKAYQGPYSKEEAIKACKTNPQSALKILNLAKQSPK